MRYTENRLFVFNLASVYKGKYVSSREHFSFAHRRFPVFTFIPPTLLSTLQNIAPTHYMSPPDVSPKTLFSLHSHNFPKQAFKYFILLHFHVAPFPLYVNYYNSGTIFALYGKSSFCVQFSVSVQGEICLKPRAFLLCTSTLSCFHIHPANVAFHSSKYCSHSLYVAPGCVSQNSFFTALT